MCREEDIRQLSRWRLSSCLAVVAVASVISFVARAQKPPEPPVPIEGLEAFLIRQDSSDCANSNVNANNPSLIGGTAWVLRQSNGNTSVKVAITGTPNTTYNFYLKCVKQLGTIATQDEGEGSGAFEFPTSSTGALITFDMYPNGAPSGNVFQSVPVTFH
jgi:hypothetical protein